MPFTFSHPAAVIPLYRRFPRHLVLSALIIGSMAPDFQYFLPFDVDRRDSHSLPGILWFCLPVGMALYLVFHLLLKRPLLGLLPRSIQIRLAAADPKLPLLPQASGLTIASSLLIGIATHLAWDALTHYGFLTVFVLPFLSGHLFSVGSYHVYPYKILQHGSTVLGAVLLWHWAMRWLRAAPVRHGVQTGSLSTPERAWTIGTLLVLPAAIGLWLATQSFATSYGLMDLKDFVREAVIIGISSFGTLLVIYGAIWHLLCRRAASNR